MAWAMASSFTLTLDTAAPANPVLLINSGVGSTGSPSVLVAITTDDYLTGARDVTEMKIWGDVDPAVDPLVGYTEDSAEWMLYATEVVVPLSIVPLSGPGNRRTLHAKLRDDVGNETVEFCASIDFDPTHAVVSIVTPVDRSKISKVPGYDRATFSWQSSVDFVAYQIRAVPSAASSVVSGVPILTLNGSANTVGLGNYLADTPITTVITGTDLQESSPGDTNKIIKIFVQVADGTWSP